MATRRHSPKDRGTAGRARNSALELGRAFRRAQRAIVQATSALAACNAALEEFCARAPQQFPPKAREKTINLCRDRPGARTSNKQSEALPPPVKDLPLFLSRLMGTSDQP
jgi:hypothetical protein